MATICSGVNVFFGIFPGSFLFSSLYPTGTEIPGQVNLKQALTEKYGPPVTDEEDWSNDLYKDKPEEYGKAVALGYLKRFTAWKTGTTEISLFLTGNDFKIDLSVDYSSTRLADPKNRAGKARSF